MFQAQQSLKQDEQKKRLAQIIAKQGIVEAERELAPYDSFVAIPLLIQLFKRENEQIHRRKLLIFGLAGTYLGLAVLCEILKRELINFPFLVFILAVGEWRDRQKKKALQRIESLATLLADRIKQAARSELGALLELAPHAWENTTLQVPLRDRLAHLLARTPTDELLVLTSEQRAGLQFATHKAIDETDYNNIFEPLAVAGLLALGSLKDKSLKKVADDVRTVHKCEQVRAATAEYLEAVR
ncbi:hypothetical protein [Armatimonas sp.]|uniref:hypothetical protein n=1 Tax=Armatimonas sp. TaxID=1872638 RepID=UPI00286CBEFB|nr:hypothetical protein [Armatimonas sp.]